MRKVVVHACLALLFPALILIFASTPTGDAFFARLASNSSVESELPVLIFDGDSITSDQGLTGPNRTWPKQLLIARPGWKDADYYNLAEPGITAQKIAADFDRHFSAVEFKNGKDHLYFLTVGTNDLSKRLPNEIYSDLKRIWATARAKGCIIIAITIQPSSGFPKQGKEADRQAINSLIRADPSLYDYLVDLDEALGKRRKGYPDDVHPSETLNYHIARAVSSTIGSPHRRPALTVLNIGN